MTPNVSLTEQERSESLHNGYLAIPLLTTRDDVPRWRVSYDRIFNTPAGATWTTRLTLQMPMKRENGQPAWASRSTVPLWGLSEGVHPEQLWRVKRLFCVHCWPDVHRGPFRSARALPRTLGGSELVRRFLSGIRQNAWCSVRSMISSCSAFPRSQK